MKNGTKIAEEFFYSYGSREYMKDHRNCDLLEKITKKSANLFVRGGDKISSHALVFGRHEIDTEELIKTYRNNGYHDFLLDIGANIGLTCCLIGNGFDRMFCFEPNPQVYRILQTNIEITFGIDHQVTLNNFGLGEENNQLERLRNRLDENIARLERVRDEYVAAITRLKNTKDELLSVPAEGDSSERE